MRVIFDKYGKIVGTPTTDDYWGQGDDLTIYLEAQFLDDNDQPIVFTNNQYLEVVVERPDGQVSPALLMNKVNDSNNHLTIGKLTITNWITEVAGKIKFNVRLKETDLNDYVTTKVTGICYRVIGQAIDPADQTITDAEYQALMDAFASKEDVANKATTIVGNEYSNTKYPTTRLLYDYIKERMNLVDSAFTNLSDLEVEFSNGTAGIFTSNGLYSCKVGQSGAYRRVLAAVNVVSGNYGYQATIYSGEMIEVLTGTLIESGEQAGHLTIPATQKKYDLSKIGFADNGTLSGLSTTDKTSIVNAINEIYTFLGSTNRNSLSNSFTSNPKNVLNCLNELIQDINKIVAGTTSVGEAVHAVNATNDEDGNQIKSTYAKLAANNQFTGENEFRDESTFLGKIWADVAQFDGQADFKSDVNVDGVLKVDGSIYIPLATSDYQAARKDQVDAVETAFLTGTKIANKATNDSSGNQINQFYGHSIEIIANSPTFQYTFQLKDATGTVLNEKTIDLPIESVVVSGTYDSANQKIVLTLQNGSTIDIPVGALISGLQTEITSQNKLASDLVDDTNQTNKFVSATEKEQITTNKEDIAALEARVDDYSYASMVYDAEDESIVVTGIALSYDGSDEELIIIR